MSDTRFTRRQCLQHLLTLAAATTLPTSLLTRCANETAKDDQVPEPFATYAAVLNWARTQNDHHPARLQALAAAGDYHTIHKYLHQQFSLSVR